MDRRFQEQEIRGFDTDASRTAAAAEDLLGTLRAIKAVRIDTPVILAVDDSELERRSRTLAQLGFRAWQWNVLTQMVEAPDSMRPVNMSTLVTPLSGAATAPGTGTGAAPWGSSALPAPGGGGGPMVRTSAARRIYRTPDALRYLLTNVMELAPLIEAPGRIPVQATLAATRIKRLLVEREADPYMAALHQDFNLIITQGSEMLPAEKNLPSAKRAEILALVEELYTSADVRNATEEVGTRRRPTRRR